MDDIIFSPLLKEIFERAALVGGDEDPFGEFVTPPKVPQPVTAERFLIAAIERSHTYYGLESERSLLRRMLERKIRDLKGLLYFTDGLGTFPEKKPPYLTAFVFADPDSHALAQTPPWAVTAVLSGSNMTVYEPGR